jgi:monofunctional glycosyltransferase
MEVRRVLRRIRRACVWAAAVLLAVLLGTAAFVAIIYLSLPDVDRLRTERLVATRYMKLRAGELGVAVESFAHEWIALERLPPQLVCAVLLAEDDGFFRHQGIEWSRSRAAAWRAWQGRPGGGASTITQQLAKNLWLSPSRNPVRKAREAILTWQLERALGKRRILELYLNVIEWADGVWGAEAASQHYTGHSARTVSLFESVFLVGLIAAPRAPLQGDNQHRARDVQWRVLSTMYRVHLIEAGEWSETAARIARAHASLATGVSVAEAIRIARDSPLAERPFAPRRPADSPIPWAAALQAECGHQRIDGLTWVGSRRGRSRN